MQQRLGPRQDDLVRGALGDKDGHARGEGRRCLVSNKIRPARRIDRVHGEERLAELGARKSFESGQLDALLSQALGIVVADRGEDAGDG